MDLRKLKTLIDLVADSDIAELEVTEGESKVRIAKTSSVQGQPVVMQQPQVLPQAVRPACSYASGQCRNTGDRHGNGGGTGGNLKETSSSRRWSVLSTVHRLPAILPTLKWDQRSNKAIPCVLLKP